MYNNVSEEYGGKKIVVLGLAKSGSSIAKILHSMGAKIIVNDAKSENKCIEKKELEELGIEVICGGHPANLIDSSVELVVKNPGIPYSLYLIQKAISMNIPVITEVEIAYKLSKAPIIGITGSNGKTTTTTLIGNIIKRAGLNPVVAGNIGYVMSEQAQKVTEKEVMVAELSSFQLKGTIDFNPHIAVIINIYPAHLDYHKTFTDYILSKAKIFNNQTKNDYAIINADCEESVKLVPMIKSNIYQFSTKDNSLIEKGTFIKDEKIYWQDGGEKVEVMALSEAKGTHLENILATIIATKLHGVDFATIREEIKNFKGVEHRIEYVLTTKNNVSFYNDSKATNSRATMTALNNFTDKVILLAGGLDRGNDFKELVEPFKKKVKSLITIGESAEKLKTIGSIARIDSIYNVDTINDAVKLAYSIAKNEDIVLLSPACASWDMFSSFEERGRMFKEAVHMI